jgi:ribosomal protein S18 acetylase RimI-like enzyme
MTASVTRPFNGDDSRATDDAAAARVCVLTGATGKDATGRYSTDTLLPDIYLNPYLEHDRDLAIAIDDGDSVVGYVVATDNTARFVDWYSEYWLPRLRAAYPADSTTPVAELQVIRDGLDPSRMLIPELTEYPAHLHIDLLPQLQGQGFGRRLIDGIVALLSERGVPGVFVQVDPQNTGALAFYRRLGFEALPSAASDGATLGLRIAGHRD